MQAEAMRVNNMLQERKHNQIKQKLGNKSSGYALLRMGQELKCGKSERKERLRA